MVHPASLIENDNYPSEFLEESSKDRLLEIFDEEEDLTRTELLCLLGQFLIDEDPHNFGTIAEARAFVHGKGKIFPKNVGSSFRLRAAVRGTIEQGIAFFPDKETKKREGIRKTKIPYEEICDRHRTGESVSAIAERAGVSRKRIRQIINELF